MGITLQGPQSGQSPDTLEKFETLETSRAQRQISGENPVPITSEIWLEDTFPDEEEDAQRKEPGHTRHGHQGTRGRVAPQPSQGGSGRQP